MGNRMLRAALEEEERYLERIAALEEKLRRRTDDYYRLIFNVKRLLLDVCGRHNEVLLRGKFSCPFMQALADEVRFFDEDHNWNEED